MYLHPGNGAAIAEAEILGVFDLDTASRSPLTRDYLKNAQLSGQIVSVSEDLPKSFIVCASKKSTGRVYLSQLNSSTLMKRCEAAAFE